jgi:hypothetical protein
MLLKLAGKPYNYAYLLVNFLDKEGVSKPCSKKQRTTSLPFVRKSSKVALN